MKLASTLCLAAASVCALAAIWSPWHWQSAATAVLLVLVGAGIAGQKREPDIVIDTHRFHEMTPEELAEELGVDGPERPEKGPQSDRRASEASPSAPERPQYGQRASQRRDS